MSAKPKTFSTAKLRCTHESLELQLPGPSALLLGNLAMECSEPRCLSGTRPGIVGPPPVVSPFQLDLSVQLTQGSTGQLSLLATPVDMEAWVPVPVFDASYALVCGGKRCDHDHSQPDVCGGLCRELRAHRVAAQLSQGTRFYVYKVPDAPAVPASLRNKLIAIPVSPGQPGNPAAASPT